MCREFGWHTPVAWLDVEGAANGSEVSLFSLSSACDEKKGVKVTIWTLKGCKIYVLECNLDVGER